jgi:hypothetical protein
MLADRLSEALTIWLFRDKLTPGRPGFHVFRLDAAGLKRRIK